MIVAPVREEILYPGRKALSYPAHVSEAFHEKT